MAQGDEPLRRYKGGHTSLGYGIDWQLPLTRDRGGDGGLLGSASFYDHRFKVWDAAASTANPEE